MIKEQKHLTIDVSDYGKCFMRLEDVLEVHPKFTPKRVYMKIDQDGKPTNEKYIKCKHVKESVSEKEWKEIQTEIVYDWFRTNKDCDVRLVRVSKKSTNA